MDTICVNGKYYDPYLLLSVTRDDELDHITKAFRRRAKTYHPDKARSEDLREKYTAYFHVLIEAYEYIKNKRSSQQLKKTHLNPQDTINSIHTQDTINTSKSSDEQIGPYSHGYGDTQRMTSVDEYDKFEKYNGINLFNNKKFSNRTFNRMFELVKDSHAPDHDKSLIHRTTDGFYGYNTDSSGQLARVSTYKGLLVVGDDYGERGVGYWGCNYADYKHSYNTAPNPQERIKYAKTKGVVKQEKSRVYVNENLNEEITKFDAKRTPVRVYSELKQQQEQDKEFVLKCKYMYPAQVVEKALAGELDKTPTLYDVIASEYTLLNFK